MAYSENQLAQLWIRAGGPPKVADMMAKLALRESGGRARINNAGLNKNGSVDYGLWQINSVHGYNPDKLYNPLYNAKAAVAVYKSQGPKAWSTYNAATDAKYIGAKAQKPSAAYGGAAPVAGATTPDAKTQLALGLLGMGGGSYGGGDALTQALIQATQQQRGATQQNQGQSYGSPPAAGKMPSGVGTFEGHKVAAWIVPYLAKARQMGWKGTIGSGYRSFADQTRIYNSGVRPAAKPGTSNHEGANFPRGAVDVDRQSAPQLAKILKRLNAPLQWAGAKDPVHFSHPHNGSY